MQQDKRQEPQGQQKGVVALLQEFVQCSRQFSAPQHRAILQWSYDQRVSNSAALEFRGAVAFLLDGLPHHVAGGWHPSKKQAQRDVAERALTFFVGTWGEQLLLGEQQTRAPEAAPGASDVQVLDEYCRSDPACGGSRPQWSHGHADGGCVAQVRFALLGVPHKFAGAAKPSKEAAYSDAARRVLWYLQCPGYQHQFGPDPRAPAVTGKELPAPPANWASLDAEVEGVQKAERKTILMRVQNRLQQQLAKQLKPGQSAWEWSYEMDEKDTVWPPLCRAKVAVPLLGQVFVGDWARGQRDAQIEASYLVSDFLDDSSLGGAETCAPSSATSGACSEVSSQAGSEAGGERPLRWADIDVDAW